MLLNTTLISDEIGWFSQPLSFFTYACNSLQERARTPAAGNSDELSVIEGQLAWMVHIIAAILKIRQTTGCRYVNVCCACLCLTLLLSLWMYQLILFP